MVGYGCGGGYVGRRLDPAVVLVLFILLVIILFVL